MEYGSETRARHTCREEPRTSEILLPRVVSIRVVLCELAAEPRAAHRAVHSITTVVANLRRRFGVGLHIPPNLGLKDQIAVDRIPTESQRLKSRADPVSKVRVKKLSRHRRRPEESTTMTAGTHDKTELVSRSREKHSSAGRKI